MKEIVSIQVGGFANYIGAHFWNIQDEFIGLGGSDNFIDPDVLYRTSDNESGITTPRLLSVDLPGSLGSFTSDGRLCPNKFPSPSPSLTWTGKTSTRSTQPHQKNLFLQRFYSEGKEISDEDIVQNLENNSRFWTDFSKVEYHPRSLYQLNGMWRGSEQGFDDYGMGREAFCMISEDLENGLRFFIEECDYLQGIHFSVDDSGGFSGVAVEFLEKIADDYTKIPVIVYTSRPPQRRDEIRQRIIRKSLHDAISFSRLSSLSDLIIPTGLSTLGSSKACSFLHLDDGNPYHTAAVYASAFNSACFPFQMCGLELASGAVEISEMVRILSRQTGRKNLAILDVAIPPSNLSGERFEFSLLENLRPLMPDVSVDDKGKPSVDFVNVRGILESEGEHTAPIHRVKKAVLSEYDNSENCHISVAPCPLPIPLPFPSIFDVRIGRRVEKLLRKSAEGSTVLGSLDVGSIPIATRLRSSVAALPFLYKRLADLKRYGAEIGAVGAPIVNSWGFEKEDLVEMGEMMIGMVKALDSDSFVSSDSE